MTQRPYATVLVESPSAMRETGFVVRIAFHVVMWTAIFMTATWFPRGGAAPSAVPATAIGEIAFRELPGDVQRMYRRCLDGLADAEEVRADSGAWPTVEAGLLVENTVTLPVQINGKKRADVTVPRDATAAQIEAAVLALDAVQRALDGKRPKKVIVVPQRIVNVVA